MTKIEALMYMAIPVGIGIAAFMVVAGTIGLVALSVIKQLKKK